MRSGHAIPEDANVQPVERPRAAEQQEDSRAQHGHLVRRIRPAAEREQVADRCGGPPAGGVEGRPLRAPAEEVRELEQEEELGDEDQTEGGRKESPEEAHGALAHQVGGSASQAAQLRGGSLAGNRPAGAIQLLIPGVRRRHDRLRRRAGDSVHAVQGGLQPLRRRRDRRGRPRRTLGHGRVLRADALRERAEVGSDLLANRRSHGMSGGSGGGGGGDDVRRRQSGGARGVRAHALGDRGADGKRGRDQRGRRVDEAVRAQAAISRERRRVDVVQPEHVARRVLEDSIGSPPRERRAP